MGNLFSAATDTVKDTVAGTVDLTRKGSEVITKPLGDVANATVMKIPGAEAVKEQAGKVTSAVTDVASKGVELAKEGTTGVTDVASKGLSAATGVAAQAADAVTKPLGDVADATVMKIPGAEAVKGVTVKAVSTTVEAAKKADELAAEGTKMVSNTATKGVEMAKDTTGALVGGVHGAFEKLGEAAGFQAMMGGVFGGDIDKSDEGLAKLFASVDTDGSGKISDVEMKQAVAKAYGKELDEQMFKKMMATADTDGDGEIDLEEFKIIMRAGPDKK